MTLLSAEPPGEGSSCLKPVAACGLNLRGNKRCVKVEDSAGGQVFGCRLPEQRAVKLTNKEAGSNETNLFRMPER